MTNISILIRVFSIIVMFFSSMTISNELASQSDVQQRLPSNEIAISQNELVYIHTDIGQIVIQLTDLQSPLATAQFKNLVNDQFYNGQTFYRVIEGFVAQGGEREYNKGVTKDTKFRSKLPAEFTQKIVDTHSFQVVQSPDLFAPETGFWKGFPAGRDLTTNEQWLLHCPGTVALARNNDPNSATTEFYIVIGQAPRHLDRNMSIIGRVIDGMSVAQAMPRGDRNNGGIVEPTSLSTKIINAKIGSEMNKEKQISYFIDNTKADKFQTRIKNARYKKAAFFVYPGNGNIDVCYHQPSITRK